ncbi:L-lysine 2,3-aminomutase [Aquimarina amphilecti]|uniref:L-lysine 2,3-aminomutase n=1 Tax=Aquimarina amphilecti TaxID=1038014 RepID=A0A1H7S745_AQUAM|nr:hypothetical protein [Aquimarina amphilecti]SEL68313.1 L-lysine 2,3-aminomutase [Aquimarina amphilecti]
MLFKSYNNKSFKQTEYYTRLPKDEKEIFDVLSSVFHFKVNNYVLAHLINWEAIPEDPIYKLVFPRKEMLSAFDYEKLKQLFKIGLDEKTRIGFVQSVKKKMHPEVKHAETGFPKIDGEIITGGYRNFPTILNLFPDPMVKTCHAYCSYCFRWVAFDNTEAQKKTAYRDPYDPIPYLKDNPEITDVLFTGADPLVLKASAIKKYIDPVLEIESVQVIRINSKALAWWPYRFTTDKDAAALLELFRYIQSKGKHLNFCAHFTHAKELENEVVKEAIQKIRETGAVIRCQGPLVKGINDTSEDLIALWKEQIANGLIPYYLFVEADHNPESCFRVPLAKALRVFQEAQKKTSGLARTVRGPVFMNDLNRVLLDGVTELNGEKYFVLKSLQSPPETNGEGKIKLIPFDEHTKDAGDLFELFKEKELEMNQIN